MAGEVTVDALPYFDLGYDDPGVKEAVSSFSHHCNKIGWTFCFKIKWSYSIARSLKEHILFPYLSDRLWL